MQRSKLTYIFKGFKILSLVCMLTATFSNLNAASLSSPTPKNYVEPDLQQQISEKLKLVNKSIKVNSITTTPIKNIYEVALEGGNIIYSNKDGNYILQGELLELKESEVVNITDRTRKKQRVELLSAIPKSEMIIYSGKKTTTKKNNLDRAIYVFSDADCGFCRKLHAEVAELNNNDIEVRYLAFPRSGPGTDSFTKMESAWCSDNRKKSLDSLKDGDNIPEKHCDNPVAKHFELGIKLGIKGTPAIFLADGTFISGYKAASDLIEIIDKINAK